MTDAPTSREKIDIELVALFLVGFVVAYARFEVLDFLNAHFVWVGDDILARGKFGEVCATQEFDHFGGVATWAENNDGFHSFWWHLNVRETGSMDLEPLTLLSLKKTNTWVFLILNLMLLWNKWIHLFVFFLFWVDLKPH